MIAASPRPHESSAVSRRRSTQFARPTQASSDLGSVQVGALRGRNIPGAQGRLTEREKELAACLVVLWSRQLERLERRLVETRGFLVGEMTQRLVPCTARV